MATLFLSLDGSRVMIDGIDPVGSPWTSVVDFEIDGVLREFTSGVRILGPEIAAVRGIDLSSTLDFQGGTLLVGSAEEKYEDPETGITTVTRIQTSTWQGRDYSITTNGFDSEPGPVIDLWSNFTIREFADGVTMTPTRSRVVLSRWRDPEILRDLGELGLLRVRPLTARQVRAAPSWAGTRTEGGEAFCSRVDGAVQSVELLTESAAVSLVPNPADMAGVHGREIEARLLGTARRLQVTWELPATVKR